MNTIFRHKSLTVLATAVIGAVAASGSALAAPVPVFYDVTAASTNLSSDGSPVTLLTQVLPAGKFIIWGKANVVNFSAADYVRCRIMSGGVQADAGATLVGNAGPGPTGEEGPSVAEVMTQTYLKLTARTTITLTCSHDFPITGEYADPGASLVIQRIED